MHWDLPAREELEKLLGTLVAVLEGDYLNTVKRLLARVRSDPTEKGPHR